MIEHDELKPLGFVWHGQAAALGRLPVGISSFAVLRHGQAVIHPIDHKQLHPDSELIRSVVLASLGYLTVF